jgi:hypothetical protein
LPVLFPSAYDRNSEVPSLKQIHPSPQRRVTEGATRLPPGDKALVNFASAGWPEWKTIRVVTVISHFQPDGLMTETAMSFALKPVAVRQEGAMAKVSSRRFIVRRSRESPSPIPCVEKSEGRPDDSFQLGSLRPNASKHAHA